MYVIANVRLTKLVQPGVISKVSKVAIALSQTTAEATNHGNRDSMSRDVPVTVYSPAKLVLILPTHGRLS